MPAIDPARLKSQSATLAADLADPHTFIRGLNDLLESYADRTRRPGQSGVPAPLLPAYHVPSPVIRQILQDLARHLAPRPLQGLAMADLLWEQENWECRVLAIHLLSRLAALSPEAALLRIKVWAAKEPEDQLLQLLLTKGVTGLREQHPELLLRQARQWLAAKQSEYNVKGLILLSGLVGEPEISDPPEIYRLLKRLLIHPSSDLRPYLRDVLAGLIKTAPQETAFFLDQCLADARSEDTAAIVRSLLPQFPSRLQRHLRSALLRPV